MCDYVLNMLWLNFMDHCYIIKIWNCVHIYEIKLKKLNEYILL